MSLFCSAIENDSRKLLHHNRANHHTCNARPPAGTSKRGPSLNKGKMNKYIIIWNRASTSYCKTSIKHSVIHVKIVASGKWRNKMSRRKVMKGRWKNLEKKFCGSHGWKVNRDFYRPSYVVTKTMLSLSAKKESVSHRV